MTCCAVLCRYNTNDLGVQGIGFIIQSDKFDAAHLALQVELFVQDTLTRLANLSEVRTFERFQYRSSSIRWRMTACCIALGLPLTLVPLRSDHRQ